MTSLSTIAEDYVKAIWSAAEWGGDPITVTALAERFGTTRATASDTVRRLAAQGLLTHEPYQGIDLTPAGERAALGMVRRHRLLETFLVRTLGYGWDEVHDEAESLEHAASPRMIDRIDELLEHPTRDPHGDPIPAKDGSVHHPANAVALAKAAAGDYEILRISDADPDRLVYFDEHGLRPGARVTVRAHDERSGITTVATGSGTTVSLAGVATQALVLVPA